MLAPARAFGQAVGRLGISDGDRIVVFDRGAIVQEGTHRQVLGQGGHGLYGRLWHHQSGGFLVE